MRPEGPYAPLAACAAALIIAALCPPLPRTLLFVATAVLMAIQYYWIFNGLLAANCVLHALGACAFIRNGGHARPVGLQDHHFLHYFVTAGACLHVAYILSALDAQKKG